MARCLDCEKEAKWYTWYKDISNPTSPPFPPANIMYNSFCDEHVLTEIKNGREGYPVVCARLIEDVNKK